MKCRIGQGERCSKEGCAWFKVCGIGCDSDAITQAENASRRQRVVKLPVQKSISKTVKKGSRRCTFKQSIRIKIFEKSFGVCYLCNESLTIEEFTIDHVIPLSKGGTNRQKNLRATHEKCNYDKADKIIKKIRKR